MKREELPPHLQRAIAEAQEKQRRYGGRVEIVQPTVPLMTVRSEVAYYQDAASLTKALGRPALAHYRSQLEADYAALLKGREMVGEILGWWYEPFTLHLGGEAGKKGGVKYRIDFLVLPANRELEIHETKGFFRRGERERAETSRREVPVSSSRPSRATPTAGMRSCFERRVDCAYVPATPAMYGGSRKTLQAN